MALYDELSKAFARESVAIPEGRWRDRSVRWRRRCSLHLGHLGVILWWLLDRSPEQRATRGLVDLVRRILPRVALALRLPLVRRFVESASSLFQEAVLGASNVIGSRRLAG